MPKTTSHPAPADWPGFTAPAYTPIPDEVFDVWLPHLSGAELKVLLYICRRTFGWKKDADAISLTQIGRGIRRRDGTWLDHGTGLAESTVVLAVQSLTARGLITATPQTNLDGDAAPTVYAPRMRPSDNQRTTLRKSEDPSSDPRGTVPRLSETQDTPLQETIQEREEGPLLGAVLAAYGGAWGTLQPLAARVCATRQWTPAQLAAALSARPEAGLRAKLVALEQG